MHDTWMRFFACVFGVTIILHPFAVFSGGETSDDDLIGSWRWLGAQTPVEEILPLKEETYLVRFLRDGKISMKIETNMVNGSYETEGGSLKLKQPLMMTMAAWRPDSPAPQFIQLMENAAGYFFQGGLLHIDTFADSGTLRFEKVEE